MPGDASVSSNSAALEAADRTVDALPGDQPCNRRLPVGPDAALYPAEVAYLTGKSLRKLEDDRFKGTGIPYHKMGRSVRYRRGDVDAYLAACRRETAPR